MFSFSFLLLLIIDKNMTLFYLFYLPDFGGKGQETNKQTNENAAISNYSYKIALKHRLFSVILKLERNLSGSKNIENDGQTVNAAPSSALGTAAVLHKMKKNCLLGKSNTLSDVQNINETPMNSCRNKTVHNNIFFQAVKTSSFDSFKLLHCVVAP